MDEQQYIHIAGITFIISADKPLQIDIFSDKLQGFAQGFPGEDSVVVRYHYSLPPFSVGKTDKLVYDQAPWQVYESSEGWNYLGITGDPLAPMFQMATIDSGYRTIDVYFPDKTLFEHHKLQSIALIPTDQIILAPILADRQACIVHSAGLIFNGAGLLFVGHSEAGKSTMVKLLRDESEILCDDRIILRRWPDGIKIHGTWSHGEIPDVSPASAPLRALLFLEKAPHNALVPMTPGEVARALPQYVIKALAGREWWMKTLDLVEHVAREVPAYRVQFDKSGAIKELLRQL